jgi:hypothetical protein
MNGLMMSTASRRIGGKVYTTFRFVRFTQSSRIEDSNTVKRYSPALPAQFSPRTLSEKNIGSQHLSFAHLSLGPCAQYSPLAASSRSR